MLSTPYKNTKCIYPVDASKLYPNTSVSHYYSTLNDGLQEKPIEDDSGVIGKLVVVDNHEYSVVVQGCSYNGPIHYTNMLNLLASMTEGKLLVWAHVDLGLLDKLQTSYKPYGITTTKDSKSVSLTLILNQLKELASKVIVKHDSPPTVAVTRVDQKILFSNADGIDYTPDIFDTKNSSGQFPSTIVREGENVELTHIDQEFCVLFNIRCKFAERTRMLSEDEPKEYLSKITITNQNKLKINLKKGEFIRFQNEIYLIKTAVELILGQNTSSIGDQTLDPTIPDNRSILNLDGLQTKEEMTFGLTLVEEKSKRIYSSFVICKYVPKLNPFGETKISHQNINAADTRVFSPHFLPNKDYWQGKMGIEIKPITAYGGNDNNVRGDVILLEYTGKKDTISEPTAGPTPAIEATPCIPDNIELKYNIYNHNDIRLNVDAIVNKIQRVRGDDKYDIVTPRTAVYPDACNFKEEERLKECVYGLHQLYDNYEEGTGLYALQTNQTPNECAIIITEELVYIQPTSVYIPIGEPHRFTYVRLNNIHFEVEPDEFNAMRKTYRKIPSGMGVTKKNNLDPKIQFYQAEHPSTSALKDTYSLTITTMSTPGVLKYIGIRPGILPPMYSATQNVTYICDNHIRELFYKEFNEKYKEYGALFEQKWLENPFAMMRKEEINEKGIISQMPYYECKLRDEDNSSAISKFKWGDIYIVQHKSNKTKKDLKEYAKYQGNRVTFTNDPNEILSCSKYQFSRSHVYDRVKLSGESYTEITMIKTPTEKSDESTPRRRRRGRRAARTASESYGKECQYKYQFEIGLIQRITDWMILSVEEKANGAITVCDYNEDGSINHRIVFNNRLLLLDENPSGGFRLNNEYCIYSTVNVISQIFKMNVPDWPAEEQANQLHLLYGSNEPELVLQLGGLKIYKLNENSYYSNIDPNYRKLENFWVSGPENPAFQSDIIPKPVYSDAYRGSRLCLSPEMEEYLEQLYLDVDENKQLNHKLDENSIVLDDLALRLTWFNKPANLPFGANSDAITPLQIKTQLKQLNRWNAPKPSQSKDDAFWIELLHDTMPYAFGIVVNLENRQIQRHRVRSENATDQWTMFELIAGAVKPQDPSSINIHTKDTYNNIKKKCGTISDILKHVVSIVCTAHGKICIKRAACDHSPNANSNQTDSGVIQEDKIWLPMKSELIVPYDYRDSKGLPFNNYTVKGSSIDFTNDTNSIDVLYDKVNDIREEKYINAFRDFITTLKQKIAIPEPQILKDMQITNQANMLWVSIYTDPIQRVLTNSTKQAERTQLTEEHKEMFNAALKMIFE